MKQTYVFIDYANVFEKVWHKVYVVLLGKLDLFKDHIHNLDWEQTTCILIVKKFRKYTNKKKGASDKDGSSHQICLYFTVKLSWENWKLYKDSLIVASLNNIRNVDEVVTLADAERKLQELLHKVGKENEKKGFNVKRKNSRGCQQNGQCKMRITKWRCQNEATTKF